MRHVRALEWLEQRVCEGRGAVSLGITETGFIGIFVADEPLCRGSGSTLVDAIESAMEPERIAAAPTEERSNEITRDFELVSQNNIARATLHFRLNKELSQGELARLAGTTQARVSDIEALKGDPKLSTLSRVAHALGCAIAMVPTEER